jgi:mRNA interferase MazF
MVSSCLLYIIDLTPNDQVPIGAEEGLKHESAIHCDELVSLPKSILTDYVGSLAGARLRDLNRTLAIAIELV